MKVYIAAPFELQRLAQEVADACAARDIACTSRWLQTADENSPEWAQRCLTDVARADVFVLINPEPWKRSGTGGRHVEFGAAVMLRKPIVIAGVKTNLFHELPEVAVVPGDEECVPMASLFEALDRAVLVF